MRVRIYRLKLVIIGTALILFGLIFSLLANWLAAATEVDHLVVALAQGVSDALFVTGAVGIAVDFFTGRDKDAADTERLRTVLKDAAPDIRNAVIAGFAETPEQLRGVATTETLDKLAINALSLRLGDEEFAAEVYGGLLAQAIRTPERWRDVDVAVRLSRIRESSTEGAARESLAGGLLDVLVTWEYSAHPSWEMSSRPRVK